MDLGDADLGAGLLPGVLPDVRGERAALLAGEDVAVVAGLGEGVVVAEQRSRGRVRLSDPQGSEIFDLTSQQATRLPLPGGVPWPVGVARKGRRVVLSSPDRQELALGHGRR